MRARALQRGEIDALLLGDAAREGRSEDAAAACPFAFAARGVGFAAGAVERACRRCVSALPSQPLARLRGFGGGAAAPALMSRRLLAFAQDHRDRRVDRHIVGSFGDQDLAERALIDGLDFHRRLVGLDLGQNVAGLDLSPSFLSHLASLPFSIVGDSAGMRILVGIGALLRRRERISPPATTSSTLGSASFSRLAA